MTVTRQPGGTPLGQQIRELVLHGDHVSPRAEALLYAADKAHHVEMLIRPALQRGDVVITDRYVDSSVAYRGAGRGLGAQEIHDLNVWAVDGLLPDLTVVVDIPAEEPPPRRGARQARVRGRRLPRGDPTALPGDGGGQPAALHRGRRHGGSRRSTPR